MNQLQIDFATRTWENMGSNIDIPNLRTNSQLTLVLKMSPWLEGALFFFVKLANSVAN